MPTTAHALEGLSGYMSALPTPFLGDRIDEHAFVQHCHRQIEDGIAALVVNGTTGEAPTLTDVEQRRLVALAVAAAAGRVPVIAGAGAPATAHAVALARQAEAAGADVLLAVTPYYNRPSQEGLFRHFRAVHDASALPVLLYDVPARTGCSLTVDTIARLAELPRIVGLKDATKDLDRCSALRRLIGPGFLLYSGDDATVLAFLRLGGQGCISVLSNLVPHLCLRLFDSWQRGNMLDAQRMARTLSPVAAAMTCESNPGPLKYAMAGLGLMRPDLRLPLCPPSKAARARIDEALAMVRGVQQLRSHAG